LTLDLLYQSDGWLRNSSKNRLNKISMLEVYHEIRGNLQNSQVGPAGDEKAEVEESD